MRHPRRKKKDRKGDKLVLRVRERIAEQGRYRVRVPMEIQQADPISVRDVLVDALSRIGELESSVTCGDTSIAATLEVRADSRVEARSKAVYWIKRAADLSGVLSFSGRGIGRIEVEEI